MAHETAERRASELNVGDRVLRKNIAWYVYRLVTNASSDIDVTYRISRSGKLKSTQTYAADDPVDVVVGGFPDRPNFTSERTNLPHLHLVAEWVRQVVKPSPR